MEKSTSKEELKKEMALFRFSLIAPVVSGTYTEPSKIEFFRNAAKKEYLLPAGQTLRFSPLTLKKWYQKYTSGGLDALIPQARMDLGNSRALNTDVKKQIHAYKEKFPYITGKKIYEKLIAEGYIRETDASVDTVYRYLKAADLTKDKMPLKECLAFEFEYANDCWQADTTVGPVIMAGGRKCQTYLISFIDDASRVLLHGEFFFEDNALHMQTVFQKAILKYGIPKRLFVDNGGPYQNKQLNWICAELGIHKIHSKPYFPQGKAKIERSHRTEKDRWMHATDWNDFRTLEDVNGSYWKYLNEEYNNHMHSSIGMTPKERYLKDFDRIRFIEKTVLEESFLHRIQRKVTPTATVSLFNTTYEVPQQYIGHSITLRYHPNDLSELYIYEESTGKRLHCVKPVKKLDNARRRRRMNINYQEMDGGNGYV